MKSYLLFTFFFSLFLTSNAQTKNYIDQPYIEISAKADTLVTPDKIYMNIILSEEQHRDRVSTEEQEKRMLDVLKDLEIDITTNLSLINLSSDYKSYFLSKDKVLKLKTYQLIVQDAQTASKVLIDLEAKKISNVFVTKTEYSKEENLLLLLKTKAIRKAKNHAIVMTAAVKQNIGDLLFVSNQASDFNQLQGTSPGIRIRGAGSIYGARSTPDLRELLMDQFKFEPLKFTITLSTKFAIQPSH